MPVTGLDKVVEHVRGVVLGGTTDHDLLKQFVRERDEAAFEVLVRRHGPMVLGVCHRVLKNQADAEDAFQATFLVLVRWAGSIRSPDALGNWLYGVAHRTALEARRAAARRQKKEGRVAPLSKAADNPNDLRAVLDQELAALPEKHRAVVVLCDLEGKTRREVAEELRCAEGTVASRLARGRTMLADRLSRHGFAVAGLALAGMLAQEASASVPGPLLASAVRLATGQAAETVSLLAEGVLKAMLVTKLRQIAVGLLVFAFLGLAAATISVPTQAGDNTPKNGEAEELKATLLSLEKRMWEASSKHDVAALDKLLAADLVSYSRLGRYRKQDSLDAIHRVKVVDMEVADVEVVPVSKDVAIFSYVGKWTVQDRSGNVIERRENTRVSDCWAWRDGRWVLVVCQETVVNDGNFWFGATR